MDLKYLERFTDNIIDKLICPSFSDGQKNVKFNEDILTYLDESKSNIIQAIIYTNDINVIIDKIKKDVRKALKNPQEYCERIYCKGDSRILECMKNINKILKQIN